MRVAVMAAGGLGGYYGALLARVGNEVTFLTRGENLKAIRTHGLKIRSVHGDFEIAPANATDDPRTVGRVDWILFAVKTYDTQIAAREILPMLGDRTAIVTFQNGVESHEQIGSIAGKDRVLVAPTQIVSNVAAPGIVEQRSQFRIMTIGEAGGGITARVERIVAEFKEAGIEATAAEDVLKPLWHKFIFIASIAGLSSLARSTPYDLLRMSEPRETLRSAMGEVYRVGMALGIRMDPDIVERQYQFCLKLAPGQKTSMQIDLEQAKRLEIDALSGAVVRLGQAKGVEVPVHKTIYAGLKIHDERAAVSRQ